ncbi:RdgB/HAM1 family non-canonical purine NTP pyrophosphatase [Tabrizicola sp. J26]|uniref:RdgB/HAM1 family non-canonical purine NTP pyrophosphatase n=1 Tax=Alitabrizicola rongguiensis TaxID=2909234 RepID=UPI001F348479|nr:RdgB/HAM1 family non-canonical purine NTP pyrophosphatase [Tabrizicola rongguiensis]MCF1708204.1 RdgB/HAM1 family non-canonical purine NTP pyrophosphatase [Tabrizicola rongguiensis]
MTSSVVRRFSCDRLVIATHNKGKLEEIAKLLEPFSVSVSSAGELGLPEPAETETTFVGNARIKAHAAARATGLPALADDSGLEVDALGRAPGVWTADWAEAPSGRDFVMAMNRVHEELLSREAPKPWTARFLCTLVLAWPDGYDVVFEGKIEGQIVWPMRGDQGHGFDPVFRPNGFDQTFGEMDRWEKNRISHRAAAFRALIDGCFT